MAAASALIDRHGRTISYLRLSVTDRCDLRCRYCMAEEMTFLPRDKLLTLDEMGTIAEHCISRGVTKIRLTGGEPLVRPDIDKLAARLGARIGHGLEELTLTTNATRLDRHAEALVAAGVRRVNVSLDSREPETFHRITRHGDVARVLAGIAAGKAAGLAIKINMVALKGLNDGEIAPMLAWCIEQGFDLSLIETMPLGAIDEDRADRFLPLTAVFLELAEPFGLVRDSHATGGPARYWRVPGSTSRLGLISPLTANFCDGCNRVRLTAEGQLALCLGQEESVDLRGALRSGGAPALDAALAEAMRFKPARHDFRIAAGSKPAVARHMSVTGG